MVIASGSTDFSFGAVSRAGAQEEGSAVQDMQLEMSSDERKQEKGTFSELARQGAAMARVRKTFVAILTHGNLNNGTQQLNKDNRSVAVISQNNGRQQQRQKYLVSPGTWKHS
jgi:hypothetical protein